MYLKLSAVVLSLCLTIMSSAASMAVGTAPGPQCGPANMMAGLTSPPTTGLCNAGLPSAVKGNGPWTWACETAGASASCFAAAGQIEIQTMSPHANLLAIKNAITEARTTLNSTDSAKQNTFFILRFPAGLYDFSRDTSVDPHVYCTQPGTCVTTNSIDLSDINPGPHGRLSLVGADAQGTTFVFNPDQVQFYGQSTNHVSIMNFHFTLDRLEASQGIVVDPSQYTNMPDWVAIDIQSGFPQMQVYPLGLFNQTNLPGNGRYLRRYGISSDGKRCNIDPAFDQLYYDTIKPDASVPNRWWFHFTTNQYSRMFKGGDIAGIKSKAGSGQAYFFYAGNDISFDSILWTRQTRGVFRGGSSNIYIRNSSILPGHMDDGQPICMSSSDGGPQIGQPKDPPTWGNVIEGLTAYNTGDDTIALFNNGDPTNTYGTTISNSFITNSFGRSILLYKSPYPLPDKIFNTETEDCNPLNSPYSACILETDQLKSL